MCFVAPYPNDERHCLGIIEFIRVFLIITIGIIVTIIIITIVTFIVIIFNVIRIIIVLCRASPADQR